MSRKDDRWELYRDSRQKWRWRRIAPNGRIVNASSQGYGTRTACLDNARRCGYEAPQPETIGTGQLSLMGHYQSRSFSTHGVEPCDLTGDEA